MLSWLYPQRFQKLANMSGNECILCFTKFSSMSTDLLYFGVCCECEAWNNLPFCLIPKWNVDVNRKCCHSTSIEELIRVTIIWSNLYRKVSEVHKQNLFGMKKIDTIQVDKEILLLIKKARQKRSRRNTENISRVYNFTR